ncbi:unnamed protein product [Jaminaea pallidilutea]
MPVLRKPVPVTASRSRGNSPNLSQYNHAAEVENQANTSLLSDQDAPQAMSNSNHSYMQALDYEDEEPYPYYPDGDYQYDEPSAQGEGLRGPYHGAQLSESFYNEAAEVLGSRHDAQNTTPAPYRQPLPSVPQDQGPTAYLPTLAPADDYQHHALPGSNDDGYEYAQPNQPYQESYDSPRSAYDDKAEFQHTPAPHLIGNVSRQNNQYSRTQVVDVVDEAQDDADYYNEKAGYYSEDGEDMDEWDREDEEHGVMGQGPGFGETVPHDTRHFGPAPAKGALLRRHKTKKQVALTQGNLVLDCPIPSKLKSFLSRRGEEEFETMRYTAVTCDPEDFPQSSYALRPALYNRHTELFIAVTLYNEDEILLTRTLHGVFKNIAHLCSRTKSRTWGSDGWKKIVVAIIADGRKKMHPRVLDCLAALGVYQEGVAKNVVNGKRVEAHLYEYTTQLSIDSNLSFKGAERGLVPVQVLLCIKERNAKKINSHKWFFSAFGPVLQPNVCVLLDAGTRPESKSIYHLWKTFDLHSNVGGACGEICADTKGRWGLGKALLNPLVAAQNFEYKMSNILDKPTESIFGYISVLPGAFSAYRYLALQNDEMGRGPLASYFKGESLLGADADVFSSNMYLAEDRILCFELAAKRGDKWVLKYIKQARGVTDVPDQLPEFISQRRRWLNGSLFAAMYALVHTRQFLDSDHGRWRMIALMIESVYSFVNVCFAWFGVANFYIFFRILTTSLESPTFNLNQKGIQFANTIAQYLYLGTLAACFVFSLGNRPQGSRWKYMTATLIFAVLTLYMFIGAIFCLVHAVHNVHDAIYAQMIVSLLATYGVYIISSCIAMDPLHLLTSFVQYLLLSPTFINILQVYAMANIHDFSWGTKGSDGVSNDLGSVTAAGGNPNGVVEITLPTSQTDIDQGYDDALHKLRTRPMIIKGESGPAEKELARKDYYAGVRTNVLLTWILSNGLLAAIILGGGQTSSTFTAESGTTRSKVYMVIVLVFVAVMSCIRLIGSTAYTVTRLVAG